MGSVNFGYSNGANEEETKLATMLQAASDLQKYRGASQNARVNAMNQQLQQYGGLSKALSAMYPGMPQPQIPTAQPLMDTNSTQPSSLGMALQQQQERDAILRMRGGMLNDINKNDVVSGYGHFLGF